MLRRIIRIDEEKCSGCGACARACHEGAIGMVNGKAKLLREDYCDGLGECLPACPDGAISCEEREAPAYDEAAVLAEKQKKAGAPAVGCPGSAVKAITRSDFAKAPASAGTTASQLRQWPVQIKLVPVTAPFFDGADLLIAADCAAYAYGNFHGDFIQGRVTLIGCPKLDQTDYAEKLAEIFTANDIKSVTVARMQVPCCGGLEQAVKRALQASGKAVPCKISVISADGRILD